MAATSDEQSPSVFSQMDTDGSPAPRIIYPNFKLVQTGVSSTVFALGVALRKIGVDVTIIGLRPPGWRDGAARMPRLSQRQGVTVWHARRNIEMLAGLVLRTLHPRTKVVFTSAAQRTHTAYTDHLISKVDAVVATSEISAGFVKRSSRVIPHGVDTDRFSPADRAGLRGALGLDPQGQYVGVFGAVRPSKGTDLFVEAAISALASRLEWRAIIVGNVVRSQREYEADLRRRVADAGLSDRIVFLGHVEDARDYIRAVDICVAPSRTEGFGLTPLEAMSSGVPVIASSAGSYGETVADGRSGLLFETGNVASLASKLSELMDDELRRAEMGTHGRARVVASFSVDREARALLDLYCELTGSSSGAGEKV
jgi:mannosyltransferase